MEYAITLYFNKNIEDDINKIILEVAKNNGNDFMLKNKIPPHITIVLFNYDKSIQKITDKINNNISLFNKGSTILSSIGMFNPNVLFLAPVKNEYLMGINEKCIKLLEEETDITFDKNYKNDGWIPHISLAVKLNEEELTNGIRPMIKGYRSMEIEMNRIAIAKCNPYKDIRIWNL